MNSGAYRMPNCERGETTISAVGRLAPHLKEGRTEELIAQAKGKTLREVQWLVATEAAEAKVQAVKADIQAEAEVQSGLFDDGAKPVDDAAIRAQFVDERDRIVPLSGERARLEAVVSREFVTKLEKAQILLARRFPQGKVEEVLGSALELLLDKEDPDRRERRREARAAKAGSEPIERSEGRRISRRLRDRVLKRDSGRCVVQEADGSRCAETRYLEIDHIQPLALGGRTIFENLRAACRRHNAQAAVAAFGEEHLRAAIETRRMDRH
ncbi:MAG: HNH endonuclease [Elusimicrobia bacterium]|nr:HNH endonuclease [Elusimicrobiota bacterium]